MKNSPIIFLFIIGLGISSNFLRAQSNPELLEINKGYQKREINAPIGLKKILSSLRKVIERDKLTFSVSYTSVSLLNLKRLTGTFPISVKENNRIKTFFLKKKNSLETQYLNKRPGTVNIAEIKCYDSRDKHLLPAIRFQQCGDCWAYSAIGALECSYIKNKGLSNPDVVDLSEKQMVVCSKAGDCDGGWPYLTFEYLKKSQIKLLSENQFPDDGQNANCPTNIVANTDVQLLDWGSVDSGGNLMKISSGDEIKAAVYKFGSVSTCILATPLFQNYSGGIFNEKHSDLKNPQINHAIMIVGWSDTKHAWLVRNSWGISWGIKGYAWVRYDCNNIGFGAIWCSSKNYEAKMARNK